MEAGIFLVNKALSDLILEMVGRERIRSLAVVGDSVGVGSPETIVTFIRSSVSALEANLEADPELILATAHGASLLNRLETSFPTFSIKCLEHDASDIESVADYLESHRSDSKAMILVVLDTVDSWRSHLAGYSRFSRNTRIVSLSSHPAGLLDGQRTSAGWCGGGYPDDFLLLAANIGLFTPRLPQVLKGYMPESEALVSSFEYRAYQVRFAEEADLPQLYRLESLCWDALIRAKDTEIRRRVFEYPEGQLVLLFDKKVVAVLYSQRIKEIDDLTEQNSETVGSCHKECGPIVQLLAVNVDPEYSNLRFGDQLLEFMLQKCALTPGVNAVVGVTLCKEFWRQDRLTFDAYIRSEDSYGRLLDPVLFFHQCHGAVVLKALPDYRMADVKNQGNGVLVFYDIKNRVIPEFKQKEPHAFDAEAKLSRSQIESFLKSAIQRINWDQKDSDYSFSPSRPLMEMGLESADLLNLHRQISEEYRLALEPTFFFQYGSYEKVVDYLTEKLLGAGGKTSEPAHRAGGNGRTELEGAARCSDRDIAVIGFSFRLPGGIDSVELLWNTLTDGGCVVDRLPNGRFHWPEYIDLEADHQGIDFAGCIDDVDCFDAAFFRVSPKEALSMDPQQRLLLELSWACIENAGMDANSLRNSACGVYIGASGSDYGRLLQESGMQVDGHYSIGTSTAVIANRLSYFYDFSGPSIQVDTACSSSLVAIHQSVQALRNGECDLALAGGINVIAHYANSVAYYKAGMLSVDGRCKTFDASANGYVRSEGAVLFLLKPRQAAERDRDSICAIIKGSAVNHGGLAAGLTVPNSLRQAELIMKALNDADVRGDDISYVEAHGTGTPLGDPIEFKGIADALANPAHCATSAPVALGSIKSNLGHLEAAAGCVGMLKVVLAMRHRFLPKSTNIDLISEKISHGGTRLQILQEGKEWNIEGRKTRLAGISSFGSGGTNAHVILEEALIEGTETKTLPSLHLFILSAQTEERLNAHADRIRCWIEENSAVTSFSGFIYTLQTARVAMRERIAWVVKDFAELLQKLNKFCSLDSVKVDDHEVMESEIQTRSQSSEPHILLLEKLARCWLSGEHVDWDSLYAVKPERLALPSYPFKKDRYWPALASSAKPSVNVTESHLRMLREFDWRPIPESMRFIQEDFVALSIGAVVEVFVESLVAAKLVPETGSLRLRNLRYLPLPIAQDGFLRMQVFYRQEQHKTFLELLQSGQGSHPKVISTSRLELESSVGAVSANTFEWSSAHHLASVGEHCRGCLTPIFSVNKLFPALVSTTHFDVRIDEIRLQLQDADVGVTQIYSTSGMFLIRSGVRDVLSIRM